MSLVLVPMLFVPEAQAAPTDTKSTPIDVQPDSYAALRNQKLGVDAPGVLGNDGENFEYLTAELVRGPRRGLVSLAEDGSFVYQPRRWFTGVDTFEYRAHLFGLVSDPVPVTIRVKATNQAPVAVEDNLTGVEDRIIVLDAPGVLANDTDPDGDALHLVLLQPPTNGLDQYRIAGDGSVVIYPLLDYNGPIWFTYAVTDGVGMSEPVFVSFEVAAVNDAPRTEDDTYFSDAVLEVSAPGVLENDSDPEGDQLEAKLFSPPDKGRLDFRDDGSFTFWAPKGEIGSTQFFYQAVDPFKASGLAAVTIFYFG